MHVSDAVTSRRSIRAFTDEPVDNGQLAELLEKASRAPSGGNLQPWRIYVLNGEPMDRFKSFISGRQIEPPAYDMYPPGLTEPYRSSRYAVGEQLYSSIGIPRDDKAARLRQLAKNYEFFGAPAGIFCFLDQQMGPPQWSDCGMFLQTFMLLAAEAGLDTCPQEAWALWQSAVSEFVGAPDHLRLFCGVAIGTADRDHPINSYVTAREPLDVFATFVA